MRVLGAILVVFGLLLCLSIVGAIVGVPLIFIGAIMLVFGGRRKVVIHNTVTVSNIAGPAPALRADQVPFRREEPVFGPSLAKPDLATATLPSPPLDSYDKKKWQSLLKYDDDIRAAAERVRPLGEKWEDELAEAYLQINDKGYLNTITDKIERDAKTGVDRS